MYQRNRKVQVARQREVDEKRSPQCNHDERSDGDQGNHSPSPPCRAMGQRDSLHAPRTDATHNQGNRKHPHRVVQKFEKRMRCNKQVCGDAGEQAVAGVTGDLERQQVVTGKMRCVGKAPP